VSNISAPAPPHGRSDIGSDVTNYVIANVVRNDVNDMFYRDENCVLVYRVGESGTNLVQANVYTI